MEFSVTTDKYKWGDGFSGLSPEKKDIYFSWHYHNFYEVNGDGKAHVALFVGNSGTKVLYPFMVKPIQSPDIEAGWYDIESAYGYGGPVVENYCENDFEQFEDLFCEWCRTHKIVAEFIRFHPLILNHHYFKQSICIEKNRTTVVVDLQHDPEKVWTESFKSENRTRIRKAQNAGVQIKTTESFTDFVSIYKSTMNSVGAGQYYFFSDQYFESLFKLPSESFVVLNAVFDNSVIASSSFLIGSNFMHYHLGGSKQDARRFAPNNLLFYEAIKIGHSRGLKALHLGGGLTDAVDDSLFRFKSTFSKQTAEFFIGKRIHNQEKYAELMDGWKRRHTIEPKLFLQYEFE